MSEKKRYVEINNELWHYIKDNETTTKYDINEVVDLLNDQDTDIKKLQKIGQEIFDWDTKRCIHILEAMQKFARQYSQDSIEFNLLYELGKELPINPNYLWPKEAFEDEGAEE